MRIHDAAIIEAALFPRNSTVLTFVYCARHSQAPFGLSWSDLKELTRDPLCLDEKQFGHWLRNQERKKEWPCHGSAAKTRKPPGRPSLNPALAKIYRDRVERLEASLRQPDSGREASELVRSLIDAVILTPADGKLEIELRGDLAGILAMSEAGKAGAFSPKKKALQIKMVAGAGFAQERTKWTLRRLA